VHYQRVAGQRRLNIEGTGLRVPSEDSSLTGLICAAGVDSSGVDSVSGETVSTGLLSGENSR
jgi:hypothetical protein